MLLTYLFTYLLVYLNHFNWGVGFHLYLTQFPHDGEGRCV